MSDDAVQITISANSADLTAQMAKAEDALKRLSTAVQGTTAGLAPLNSATAQVISQYDKAAGTLTRAQGAFQHVTEALAANEISATQASRIMGQIASNADAAAAAGGRLGHGTAGATREFIVLGHEVVSGNFSRIPGSLMVLAQRSGNLSGIMSALVSPVGLVGIGIAAASAVMIGMAASAERADRAMIQLQTGFAAVGNGSRESVEQLRGVVETISRLPGVNREAAGEIISDFSRTRQIGGQLFSELTATIDQSARAMGVEAPAAAKTLAAAFADPTKGAQQLHEAYGILTQTQITQIATMQRAGDLVGAQGILLSGWKARLAELPPGLTQLQTASNDLANAWDRLMQSFGHNSIVEAARDKLAGLLELMARHIDPTPLDRYNDALTHYNEIADRLNSEQEGPFAKMGIDPRIGQLTKDLQDAKANLDKAQSEMLKAATPATPERGADKNPADYAADRAAQIRTAHVGDDTQIKALDADIKLLNDDLDRAQQRLADLAHTKGTDSNEYRAEKVIVDQDIASLAKLKQEKDAIGRKTVSGPSDMEKWQTELAEQNAAENASRMEQLENEMQFWQAKRAQAGLTAKDIQQIDKQTAQVQIAINKEVASFADQAAAQQRQIAEGQAATSISLANSELEMNKQLLAEGVADGMISATQKIQIEKSLTAAVEQGNIDQLRAEQARYEQGTIEFQKYADQIRILQQKIATDAATSDAQMAQAMSKSLNSDDKQFDKMFQPMERAFDEMLSGVLRGTQTMQQAVARAGINMAASYAEEIGKMTLKYLAFEALQALGWDEMAAKVLGSQAAQTAAVTAGTTAQAGAVEAGQAAEGASQDAGILKHAGSAAASVYDEVSQIPYIGWLLAPPAAAAAFAAVAAFSAEGGMGTVPFDNAPFLLHKNEMVLPANIAGPLRSMLGSSSFNSQTNSSSTSSSSVTNSGGDMHVHFNVSALDAAGVQRFFNNNGAALGNTLSAQLRNLNSSLISSLRGATS